MQMDKKSIWKAKMPGVNGANIVDVLQALSKMRNISAESGLVSSPDYVADFHEDSMLEDFEASIERVISAKERDEKIFIFGDYDVDGITSSAILAEALEKIGVKFMVYLPHREDEGYGLTEEIVVNKIKDCALLIAIDNGTSAFSAVHLAREKGLDVIIIDHHTANENLPEALVVNPHRLDNRYPFTELCAAGLAFKFGRALLERYGREEEAKWFLDLAALGTIADRMPLVNENRAIVFFGLKVLRVTRRLGLISLMGRAGLFRDKIDTENLAFKIIPRLNAAGRMQHADLAYNLIRAKDHLTAEKLAVELDSLNNERRSITTNSLVEIKKILQKKSSLPDVLCLGGPWPVGIVGILAGKIAEEFSRPAAIVSIFGDYATGSIRGNGNANVVELMAGISDSLTKYGGHYAAGGFSFAAEKWPIIEEYFNKLTVPQNKIKNLYYDLELQPSFVNMELFLALQALEPHGEENQRPVFLISGLEVEEFREIGANRDHRRFILRHHNLPNETISGVAFNWKNKQSPVLKSKVDVLCELRLNEFRDNKSVDLVISDIR